MSTFRFLHAADIHLDSPLRGLERYEDAPAEEIRTAPRTAFRNLVDLALEERVAFLLLAGDLYDGDWKDHHTGLFFVREIRRLEDAEIPVFLVSGNHDAISRITRQLSLPSNVVHFPSERPETFELESLGVAIHGQSFGSRSVPRDLSADYPSGSPDRFDVGLLHTSLDGRPGHADYAPCTLESLRSRAYDYWALGHVHAREVVAEDPWVVFPGNLQGRHARETGAKGATLVSVEAGRVTDVEHRALDVVRWAGVEVDVSSVGTGVEAVGLAVDAILRACDLAEERLLAARVRLVGRSPAHESLVAESERWDLELREAASAAARGRVWLEKIEIATQRPVDLDTELAREDALGDLLRSVVELEETPELIDRLGEEFADLARKLPPALREDEDGFDPRDAEALRRRLPAARDLILSRLLEAGEGA